MIEMFLQNKLYKSNRHHQLKTKLQQFLKKYRIDINFNYLIYEETISELRNELNKTNVKKALSSVLQNDILNNIEMKLSLE